MSSEDEKNKLCSKCEGKMDSLKDSWSVEIICDQNIYLKCIMADYPKEINEVFCSKWNCMKKIKHEDVV